MLNLTLVNFKKIIQIQKDSLHLRSDPNHLLGLQNVTGQNHPGWARPQIHSHKALLVLLLVVVECLDLLSLENSLRLENGTGQNHQHPGWARPQIHSHKALLHLVLLLVVLECLDLLSLENSLRDLWAHSPWFCGLWLNAYENNQQPKL